MNFLKSAHEFELLEFLTKQTQENDSFTLLTQLAEWFRQEKGQLATHRFSLLFTVLKNNPELSEKMAKMLCSWLCSVRLYPLFISAGIFSREGFKRELLSRLYEKLNPAYKDMGDLRDVFSQIFSDLNDERWLKEITERQWLEFFHFIRQYIPQQDRENLKNYIRQEGFYAIEMLSIWIAAEELEPNLIRVDKRLLDLDSPLVALNREVNHWIQAKKEHQEYFDSSHLDVMLIQCYEQVETLRKKGTYSGSSLNIAHLLERLEQTLNRLTLLMKVFEHPNIPPYLYLKLTGQLAIATIEQHNINRLWKKSMGMLSRSITQHTSSHGEHYIVQSKKEYWQMFYSAAGGGILIAFMSLFKIYFSSKIDNPFWLGIAEGLNYGIGFTFIYLLGLTVATKQPAMTASHFASAVEKNDKGKAVNLKLAQLLMEVIRSQSIAVFGNIFMAISLAGFIAYIYHFIYNQSLLNEEQVIYQLKSVDIFSGTLWYASIAGLWLFCSGIISGFFDNRSNYLNTKMRLRQHPILKILLNEPLRIKFAEFWHENYGAIMGNLCFGLLLGMTGFIGKTLEWPLDIRHVAFSSANIGFASVSGSIGFTLFLQSLIFVLLIGLVNLIVSFSLTLSVALRARECEIDNWWEIFTHLCKMIYKNPKSLFSPKDLPNDE